MDIKHDIKQEPNNDFEIVQMQLRRRTEASRERVFETQFFTAIAKGYIVEKITPSVDPASIDIKEHNLPQFLRNVNHSTQTVSEIEESLEPERNDAQIYDIPSDENETEVEIRSFRKTSENESKKKNKLLIDIGIFVMIFVTVFLSVVFFNVYVHHKNIVYGASMEPTLHEDDVVYTTKLSYIFGEPEVGDIVVIDIELEEAPSFFYMVGQVIKQNAITDFFSKEDEPKGDTCWIKRVVGVAGDYIEFKDNKFYRNGKLVEEEYLKTQNVMNYPDTAFTVEEGMIYCMGDNRNVSKDSRNIGQIPVYQVLGKVWKIQEKSE